MKRFCWWLMLAVLAAAFQSRNLPAQGSVRAQAAEGTAAVFIVKNKLPEGKIAFDSWVVPISVATGQVRTRHDEASTKYVAQMLGARIAQLSEVSKCEPGTYICHFDDVRSVVSVSHAKFDGDTAHVVVRTNTEVAPRTKRPYYMCEFMVTLISRENEWVVTTVELVASS